MNTFFISLGIAFIILLAAAIIISFAKRRQNRTSHGLTGMCHESGGTMCSCCSSQYLAGQDSKKISSCRRH